MPRFLEKISAAELQSLSLMQTAFFFPVGPLEDHGPHLPLGLDGAEAEAVCWALAEKLELDQKNWVGVIMPRMPLGIESNTTSCAITVRGYVLRDWLVDSCTALFHLGFRYFICLSGHPGPRQLTAIEEASKILDRKAGGIWPLRLLKGRHNLPVLVSASSALPKTPGIAPTLLWPDPKEHGGKRDTSVALHLMADQVGSIYQTLPRHDRADTSLERLIKRWKKQTSGYWGTPNEARPEVGEKILKDQVDTLYPKMRAVLEGASPQNHFRSWYSIIPLNRTFFKAWILAFCILFLMLLWMLVILYPMVSEI